MKLVSMINNLTEAGMLSNYTDVFFLKNDLVSVTNLEKLTKYNKDIILDFSCMVTPKDLNEVIKKINLFIDFNCLFYITDLGLAYYFKEAGCIERVIYDPVTMITNSLDAKEYFDYGFNAIGISNEITLKDTKEIISKTKVKAFLQVFGYRIMFNSRRKLVSLYLDKINKHSKLENMYLKESTRNDFYPITEDEYGTKIYRSYCLNLLDGLLDLDLEYAFLTNLNIEFDKYLEVVKIYRNYLNGANLNECIDKFNTLDIKTEDGFKFKDSIYNKELF